MHRTTRRRRLRKSWWRRGNASPAAAEGRRRGKMCSRSGVTGIQDTGRWASQERGDPGRGAGVGMPGSRTPKRGGYLPPRPGSWAGWPGALLCSRAASCAASARCRVPRRPGSSSRPRPRALGSVQKAVAARGPAATLPRGPCRCRRGPALLQCRATATTAAGPAPHRALAPPPPSHSACARSLAGPFGTFPRPARRSHTRSHTAARQRRARDGARALSQAPAGSCLPSRYHAHGARMRSRSHSAKRTPRLSRERQVFALSSVGVEDYWHETLWLQCYPMGHKEDHRDERKE